MDAVPTDKQLKKNREKEWEGEGQQTYLVLLGQLIKGGKGQSLDTGLHGQENSSEAGRVGGDDQHGEHPPESRQHSPRHGPWGRRVACTQRCSSQ